MFVLEFVAAVAGSSSSNHYTHTHTPASHSPVAACSPVRVEIEEGKSSASARAISAADNKRRRDAGGAKSASLSEPICKSACLSVCASVCAFYIIQFWAFSARQVCFHCSLLIRSVVARSLPPQGASAIRCNSTHLDKA